MHSGAVTTMVWIAPGNDWSMSQDGSKCTSCGLNLPHIPQLVLDCASVTAITWIPPANHRSVSQDGSECATRRLNLLTCLSWSWTAEQSPKRPQATTDPSAKIAANAPIAVDLYNFLYTRELILNSGLVFAIVWIAPRNDRSVGQDRQQGTTSTHGLNLARILELILKCGPVTTNEWMACIAPGNQWSICQNCGNAQSAAWTFWTFLGRSGTFELSPTRLGWPQDTTDPSAKMAANALPVASICCTFLSWSWTVEQSPP